ncbi:hypothetical protein DRE_04630 [Drechslerella stenobrocha 248]|uniref:Uncharacterized protein n=1 Tax=Drechslerella stenobrocha 248 TaxID=1043628 RepID=W7HPL4_9PEZI|nr:hypothetical protein DRE_04630 [Drechslerella stenobrocha 248]
MPPTHKTTFDGVYSSLADVLRPNFTVPKPPSPSPPPPASPRPPPPPPPPSPATPPLNGSTGHATPPAGNGNTTSGQPATRTSATAEMTVAEQIRTFLTTFTSRTNVNDLAYRLLPLRTAAGALARVATGQQFAPLGEHVLWHEWAGAYILASDAGWCCVYADESRSDGQVPTYTSVTSAGRFTYPIEPIAGSGDTATGSAGAVASASSGVGVTGVTGTGDKGVEYLGVTAEIAGGRIRHLAEMWAVIRTREQRKVEAEKRAEEERKLLDMRRQARRVGFRRHSLS